MTNDKTIQNRIAVTRKMIEMFEEKLVEIENDYPDWKTHQTPKIIHDALESQLQELRNELKLLENKNG